MMPSLLLHHYTSGTGLAGIFDSKTIWASSIHQLNDAKEFSHAIDLAKIELKRAAKQHTSSNSVEVAAAVCGILDRCTNLSIYVVCFSEVADSLSQWRGYCPDGFGYSIGFDGENLRKIAKRQGFYLNKCMYSHEQQSSLLNTWAVECLEIAIRNFDATKPIHELEICCNDHLNSLFRIAPYFKDSSFSDEHEWRLAGLVASTDDRLRLRPGKSMLVRYAPIQLDLDMNSELVWNIQVGPTPHPDLAVDSLTYYFGKVAIRNGIGRSSSPYRTW